jgi:hypothetical protein
MSKPTPTKSLAESTMAMLGQAMDRNSQLVASARPVAAAPIASVPAAVAAPTPPAPVSTFVAEPQSHARNARPNIRTSGLRFTSQDHDRINRIINQALSIGQRIPMSDAVRLALIAYDPRMLRTSDITALQATDGRIRRRTPSV